MRSRVIPRVLAAAAALSLVAGACGDDDDDDAAETTLASETTGGGGSETSDGGSSVSISEENAEICALAQEIFGQESFPTAAQLEQYQEIAPDEIEDAVSTAAPALIDAGQDPVAQFAAFAEDDVEEAVAEIDAWEEENCGIPHSDEDSGPGQGATREIEDDATRVDVVASEYTFTGLDSVEAGRTSFVMTAPGNEAHFMYLVRLAEGVDLPTLLESEGGEGIEGEWSSNLAAPGGDDEEALSVDLEPGNYGMLCFVPGPDGTPHAFSGMAVPFTVS